MNYTVKNTNIKLPDRYRLQLTDKATLEDVILLLNSLEITVMDYVLTAQMLNSPGIELTKLYNNADDERSGE